MSASAVLALVVLFGLLAPLVLYALVRSETEPERMDRGTALQRARRDAPSDATGVDGSRGDRASDTAWGDGPGGSTRDEDEDDDRWAT